MHLFLASVNHESAGIIFMDIYKETASISASIFFNFQLQFKVIVLAVLLASSSEQQRTFSLPGVFY